MGYTHYLELKKFPKVNYKALQEDVQKALPKGARNELNNNRLVIQFEVNEDFYFDSSNLGYEFCKTNRVPKDLNVCKTLLVLKHYYGSALDVTSDGFSNSQPEDEKYSMGDVIDGNHLDENWAKAIQWYTRKFKSRPVLKVDSVHGEGGCYFRGKLMGAKKA